MNVSVIQLDALSKWYGEVIGLNNVTTTVQGGITGLVGPNGAGKSTLMGLATGQLRPSQGSIRLLGERAWNNPAVLSRIGYCPEGDRFWPALTGMQFVRFLARVSGLRGVAAGQAAARAIEATGMTEHMHRPIRAYSKGMRQRIKVSQALVHKPDLLILDEPFTGTDPVARYELAALFRRLAEEGVDILMSSHVLHEVEAVTRQILMIDRGRIVAQGKLHEVRSALHNRPHAIRIRADRPRQIAAGIAAIPAVSGLRVSEPETLIIETTDPEHVHRCLTQLALAEGVLLREIAPADDSLEALFGYLTDRSG